ncbi:hypothetical protein [Cutibacterium avidum]|uniref:hypothetical protein n=1 Tax=Cutibacterium avidum TaxID=33010 RepID=UPI002FF2FEB9
MVLEDESMGGTVGGRLVGPEIGHADPGEHRGRSIIVAIEHSPHEKDHHLE